MWKEIDTATIVSVGSDSAMDTTQRCNVRFASETKSIAQKSAPHIGALSKPRKSAMTVLTQDESLHGKKKTRRRTTKKELQWDTIEIREYKRTVGDNPSCSSGPPLA